MGRKIRERIIRRKKMMMKKYDDEEEAVVEEGKSDEREGIRDKQIKRD